MASAGVRRPLARRTIAQVNRAVALGHEHEVARFLDRGTSSRAHQPVASVLTMLHELIDQRELPVDVLFSRGEFPADLRNRSPQPLVRGVSPGPLNPATPVGATTTDPLVEASVRRTYSAWSTYKFRTTASLQQQAQARGVSVAYLVPSVPQLVARLKQLFGAP